MLKRAASLLLCLLMVFSAAALVSCSDEENASGTVSLEGDAAIFDKFAKESNPIKNWNNAEVTILGYRDESRVYSTCQVDTDATNGEAVNDAFYKRNELIKQNFGIDVKLALPDEGEDPIQMLRLDIETSLCEFDAIMNGIKYLAPLGMEGLFYDLSDVNHINLDKAWWDQTIIKDVALNNKVYFITGDALVNDDEATYAVYFNKDIARSYGLGDIYALVHDGKWTVDKMYEMIKEVSNDQQKTFEASTSDTWGMISQSYDILSFMHGMEQQSVDNTGDEPRFRIDDQANITAFQKIHEVLADQINVGIADNHGRWDQGIYDVEIQMFANGAALFMPNSVSLVNRTEMRESEISFGILPMPKLNEQQTDYTTSVNVYACAVFAVPISNEAKLDLTCYALEAMAFLGKEYVTEEYYTRTVSLKRLKDAQDSEMLDYIFRNRTYDLGCVFDFGSGVGSGSLYFYSELLDPSANIVSHYESKKDAFNDGLQDLINLCY